MIVRFLGWLLAVALWLASTVFVVNAYIERQEIKKKIAGLEFDRCMDTKYHIAWMESDRLWWEWYYSGMRGAMPIPPAKEQFEPECGI